MYGIDHEDKLPSGASENYNPIDEHIPVISTVTRSNLIHYSGDYRMLECPSMGDPFKQAGGWYYADYGFVIGYNYLGGHVETPWPAGGDFEPWVSPQNLTEPSDLPVLTDFGAPAHLFPRTSSLITAICKVQLSAYSARLRRCMRRFDLPPDVWSFWLPLLLLILAFISGVVALISTL